MVAKNSNVAVAPYQTVTFSGDYAGEYFVKNNSPITVEPVSVDDSGYENNYGPLPYGNGVYGVWIGGGANVEIRTSAPAQCPASAVNWGAGNFCSAVPVATTSGGSVSLTNSVAGANGSAVASCSAGTWTISSSTCTANLTVPVGLFATDGANTGSININWGAVQGAGTYRLQQRKQGTSAWTDLVASSATSYNWTGRTDESIFEFQVRAENSVGASAWSAIETGYIRPALAPVFVSQTGIPSKIGVGQTFTFSQVWKNTGSETWTGTAYGTSHHAANGAIQWGIGFTSFTGSTATSAQVTTTMTGTAPASAGTYTLQRVMQKSGTSYGVPSTAATVVVYDTPKCTAVNTDVSTTFNPTGTVTATLFEFGVRSKVSPMVSITH
jgi:hypothetical protein